MNDITDSKRQTRRLTHAQIVLLDDWLRSAGDALHQAVPKVAEAASAALGFTVPESSIRTGAEARGLSIGRLPEPDLFAALEARVTDIEERIAAMERQAGTNRAGPQSRSPWTAPPGVAYAGLGACGKAATTNETEG